MAFVTGRYNGIAKADSVQGWMCSFCKQFYGPVTKLDYLTLRLVFIMNHCKGNPKYDFHGYLMRVLESGFNIIFSISWYLWLFVFIFLLLNITAWYVYFWIASIPLILLIVLGSKLEHIITVLAQEVAEKYVALEKKKEHTITVPAHEVAENHETVDIEGDAVVRPSGDLFWFRRPRLVLFLIHFMLFQNSFELVFLFFIWVEYGPYSCIIGQVKYVVPRVVIGLLVQLLCSYSTLPLYALVTQMESSLKPTIFKDYYIYEQVMRWAGKFINKRSSGVSGSTPQLTPPDYSDCETESSRLSTLDSGSIASEIVLDES